MKKPNTQMYWVLNVAIRDFTNMWAQRDLNPRPIDYESTALTN